MNDKVHKRVRSWIAASGLKEGGRLPAERELSAQLGVSRAELRKALLVLEVEGRVTRGAGRGTFLTRRPASARGAGEASAAALAERTSPHEAMVARIALEPQLAAMAALHANPQQIATLRELAAGMRAARSWSKYENLDSEFHDVIAEASGNGLLHEVHRIVNGVRMVVVWRRLDTASEGPDADYHSFAEHDAIVAALEARDGEAARAAMRAHLKSTLAGLTAASGG